MLSTFIRTSTDAPRLLRSKYLKTSFHPSPIPLLFRFAHLMLPLTSCLSLIPSNLWCSPTFSSRSHSFYLVHYPLSSLISSSNVLHLLNANNNKFLYPLSPKTCSLPSLIYNQLFLVFRPGRRLTILLLIHPKLNFF